MIGLEKCAVLTHTDPTVCGWTVMRLFLFYPDPPKLSAYCKNSAAGYSMFIGWHKPDGIWTAVEAEVTGELYITSGNRTQNIEISGLLPARTYEVSITSLSGTVRSPESFVFSCTTDPRGESKLLFESASWCHVVWFIRKWCIIKCRFYSL